MRFNGGPYDQRELPIQPPLTKLMRLPQETELDAFLGLVEHDPAATGHQMTGNSLPRTEGRAVRDSEIIYSCALL